MIFESLKEIVALRVKLSNPKLLSSGEYMEKQIKNLRPPELLDKANSQVYEPSESVLHAGSRQHRALDRSRNALGLCGMTLGFTLAEVLITLGIIGVVAAMTIPTVMNNIQEQQYKTAYKKAYSDITRALLQANQDNSLVSPSMDGDTLHLQNFIEIMNQFKITKKCITNNNSECWDDTGEKFLVGPGYPINQSYAFIDNSGIAWSMYYAGYCMIFVDTNAFKKPNEWGKDRFIFLPVSSTGGSSTGIPIKIIPLPEDHSFITSFVCLAPNKCSTNHNYHSTSWLYD